MISAAIAMACVAWMPQVSFEEQIVYPPPNSGLGTHIAIGDVTGDQVIDLAVASPHLDGSRGGGYLFVGPEFDQVFKITSSALNPATALPQYNGDGLGLGVWRIRDVNADGYADLLAGAAGATGPGPGQWMFGRAFVFFGPDLQSSQELAAPSHSIPYQGFGVYGDVGDVTGDGLADIVISSSGFISPGGSVGRLSVYDGAAAFANEPISLIAPPGTVIASSWGQAVLVDDFDGDGGDDVLLTQGVLQPFMSLVSYLRHGLNSGTGYFPWFLNTANVNYPERKIEFIDVNGDGARDLVQYARNTNGVGGGRLILQYGPAFQTATILNGSAESALDGFGMAFDVGDVDRDGHVDLAVGQQWLNIAGTPGGDFHVGRMTLFFGPTFTQTMEFDGTYHSSEFGGDVAVADTDGDGFAEVFCSETRWGGRVHIYRHHTLRLTGPTEVSITSGAIVPMSIEVGKLSGNAPYLMLMSASGAAPGLDVPYAGGTVHVPVTFDVLTSAGLSIVNTPPCAGFLGTLDGNGTATSTLTIPGGAISPVFAGLWITCAAVVGDAQGNLAYATRAVTIPLVP